ncbi:MAG: hypothetical protein J6I96_03735 [Oscillospiraceae bacterium]|nr:hypothetical protein [Oscillospiraceae bacterium]
MKKKIITASVMAIALLTACEKVPALPSDTSAAGTSAAPSAETTAISADETVSPIFTKGVYMASSGSDDVYYVFYDEKSGRTENADGKSGIGFECEQNGSDAVFHFGSPDDITNAHFTKEFDGSITGTFDYDEGAMTYSFTLVEGADPDTFELSVPENEGDGLYDDTNETSDSDDELLSDDGDTQNPVMNFVGAYGVGRANMEITAEGSDSARIKIWWSSSAFEHSEWEMTGKFDPDTLTIEYTDCTERIVTFSEEGEESSETVYTDGTGRIIFSDGDPITLTWTDDVENAAEDLVFEYYNNIAE